MKPLVKQCIYLIPLTVSAYMALLTGCARDPQAREARFLKSGAELVAKKDYPRALLNFLNAAQAVPGDAEAQYRLGLVYLAMENRPQAVAAFRKATQLNPQHVQANLRLAEIMATTTNQALLQDAASRIHKVLNASPDNPEARDALAVTEFQTGNVTEAANQLEATLRQFPAHLQSAQLLARVMLSRRDYQGAEDVLEKAVSAAPSSPQAAVALAQIQLILDQPDKAEAATRQALTLAPASAEAMWTLAGSQMARKQWDQAGATLAALSALPDKRYESAHALFLYHSGKRDEAVAELEKLSAKDKDNRDLRTQLIAALFETNRVDRARTLISDALAKNPRDQQALFQRSELSLRSGNIAQAGNDLTEVLHYDPDSAQAHYLLSIVDQSDGRDFSARQELNEALKHAPNLLAARIDLAKSLLRGNQPGAALEILDRAPKVQKATQAFVIERNWVLLKANRVQEVRQTLDALLPSHKTRDLLLQDALLNMASHDYGRARSRAEEVLLEDPAEVRAATIIAESYQAQHQTDEGVKRLEQIAAARPQSAILRELLGKWYLIDGKNKQAQQAFEAAEADGSRAVSAELGLAELDRREGHVEAAVQRVNRIRTAAPRDMSAVLMLASLQTEAGDTQAAIAAYRAALEIDSENTAVLNNLAYLIAPLNAQEALDLAHKAAQRAPGNLVVQDTLGWVYYRCGNYTDALNYLKLVYDKEPTPQHQFHLGMSYLRSGDRLNGAKLLEAALKQNPNLPQQEKGW